MKSQARHLVWFRNDLRVHDNPALFHACESANTPVMAIWFVTPQQWKRHDTAACRIDFDLRSVSALSKELVQLNIALRILEVADFSAIPEALLELCQKEKVSRVFANREYPVYEQERDLQTEALLAKNEISFHLHEDQCILPPGTLKTGAGDWYSVFTPFKKAWINRLVATGNPLFPVPAKRERISGKPDAVPSCIEGFRSDIPSERWPAGERIAIERLTRFCKEDIRDYQRQRDFPAIDGTSSLSPYLANGSLSPRLCLNRAIQENDASFDRHSGPSTWISELCWRDFYKHVLVGFPRVSRHQPVKKETGNIPWRNDESEFRAWCEGRTGFPIVDAAMRQLNATGWMHNRLRMIVAMFLTKDLLIDWRKGERYFMQHLIDGDLAANNGGWQWSASTGNDAVPYFRIFNPFTQSERFDPEGDFIRHWVPELAHLDKKSIHCPPRKGLLDAAPDYPAPLVDHAFARERTLLAFKQARSGEQHERPATGSSGAAETARKRHTKRAG